jgi:predicted TIM-barrel enzyme
MKSMSSTQIATAAVCSHKGEIDSKSKNEVSKDATKWKNIIFIITLLDFGDSNEIIIDFADSLLPNVYLAAISSHVSVSTNLFNVRHPSN